MVLGVLYVGRTAVFLYCNVAAGFYGKCRQIWIHSLELMFLFWARYPSRGWDGKEVFLGTSATYPINRGLAKFSKN